ncbi:MAG: sulfur carrier protein ThiS [Pyrinomonadaceae bacterium]
MNVVINGEEKDVPNGFSLDKLLEFFDFPSQRVAVELNRNVVRRNDWKTTTVQESDRIEVVHFVGGG